MAMKRYEKSGKERGIQMTPFLMIMMTILQLIMIIPSFFLVSILVILSYRPGF